MDVFAEVSGHRYFVQRVRLSEFPERSDAELRFWSYVRFAPEDRLDRFAPMHLVFRFPPAYGVDQEFRFGPYHFPRPQKPDA